MLIFFYVDILNFNLFFFYFLINCIVKFQLFNFEKYELLKIFEKVQKICLILTILQFLIYSKNFENVKKKLLSLFRL